MTFRLGDKKPSNSGRRKGVANKNTELVRSGMQTAVEICRSGDGPNPIGIMMSAARLIDTLNEMRLRHLGGLDAVSQGMQEQFDLMIDSLVKGAEVSAKVAPFAFPKLAAMDYVGDAPRIDESAPEIVIEYRVETERPARFKRNGIGNGQYLDLKPE
jgi:hypothetical protein